MSTQFNSMFNETEPQEVTANARSLAGTAQLTSTATSVVNEILRRINEPEAFEQHKALIEQSKRDHHAMDRLIAAIYKLEEVDVEFIKQLDESVIDNMLKSQQSKRSRSKGKVMTMDNYRSMMVGAVAENLIRLATGKAKSASGTRHEAGVVTFTDEELTVLQNDQEKLRKEIRNVQSKKSIMKSKEGFKETDERWQVLLKVEAQLKGLRSETTTVVVDETKNALTELLSGVDVSHMKAADAKSLIEKAMSLIAAKEDQSDEQPTE